jgi:hypothetical protein
MKVILIGLPYFANKISKNLTRADKNIYLAIDTSAGVWQKVRYVWHILFAKVLYQIGGSHCCGGALRLAMVLNKKIVMHWVGTDVLKALKDYNAGVFDSDLIKITKHLCEVEWIQKELLNIGIQAEIAQIACFPKEIPCPPPLPKRFSILSYIGKGREKFYGIDKLINLAQLFPDIPFRIVGISEYYAALPSNIQLVGWVEDMAKEYKDCVLYLRLPKHDGLPFSVLEALSYGRYVGYTYSLRGTNKVVDINELYDFVEQISLCHKKGLLGLNNDGHRSILEHYLENIVMPSLVETLTR